MSKSYKTPADYHDNYISCIGTNYANYVDLFHYSGFSPFLHTF